MLSSSMIVFFHTVVNAGSLGMLYNDSQYSLCLHSCLASIMIWAQIALSFLLPCGCYAVTAVSTCVTEK